MSKRIKMDPHRLGVQESSLLSEVHEALLPKMASAKVVISRFGLTRVAGNVYECPSTKDFWEVKGDKIFRLTTANEVDNGENLVAADHTDPEATLNQILADLEFYED